MLATGRQNVAGCKDVNWTLSSDSLPEGWTCVLASHTLDPNATLPARFIRAPVDAYTPDLVGAVDCVLGTTARLAHTSSKRVAVPASLTLTDTTRAVRQPLCFVLSQLHCMRRTA